MNCFNSQILIPSDNILTGELLLSKVDKIGQEGNDMYSQVFNKQKGLNKRARLAEFFIYYMKISKHGGKLFKSK